MDSELSMANKRSTLLVLVSSSGVDPVFRMPPVVVVGTPVVPLALLPEFAALLVESEPDESPVGPLEPVSPREALAESSEDPHPVTAASTIAAR